MTAPEPYHARGGPEPGSRLPLVGQLLAFAATGAPLLPRSPAFAWRPEGGDARQFRWVLEGGLGPLLHRALRDCADIVPPAWREALLAADLTARVRHGNLTDTTLEVLDACEALPVRATLLKGISVSEQLYPEAHLRPMGDIDILIPAAAYAPVEATLLARGYHRLDGPAIAGHHHGVPLRHSGRRTLVELHTALFPADSALRTGTLFGATNVALHSIGSHYHGRPVQRLTPELQLAYIASSWCNDLTLCKVHPSFLASLFDAVYLLAASGRALDWRGMAAWLDNDMARASLHAMVTYLPRYGVAPLPTAALAQLASSQTLVGPLQLALMHRMLDHHLIGGRPWRLALPPPVPGRYSLVHQFRKRVLDRRRHPAQATGR
ncbi:MAG: nucleotidyltransferase family protein [Burkholderiaceae bacterium]